MFLLQAATSSADEAVAGVARRKLVDVLASEGKGDEALLLLQSQSEDAQQSAANSASGPGGARVKPSGLNQEFFDRLAEAKLLQQKGDNEKSYAALAKLLKDYPTGSDMILAQAKMPFTLKFGVRDNEAAYKELNQLAEAIPDLANDPSLLSDQIVAAKSSKQLEMARKLAEKFVKTFPDHRLAPGHLFFLASDAFENGEHDRAKSYFTLVAEHAESPEDYRRIANSNLGLVAQKANQGRPIGNIDDKNVAPTERNTLLIVFLNLIVFFLIGGVFLLKKRGARTG